jgi:adenylyltransferase/sulfurtransferase
LSETTPDNLHRYHRQILLPGFGEEGQRRLLDAHALVVGCGALGSVIIDCLARAGVGTLTIVDRDVVEITNLQRQVLYDESDVAEGMPKAEAAKAKVAAVNAQVTVHAHVDDFNYRNAARYADGVDIILDGLDNFETRYLLNDLAVARGLPYIYGGAVATTGVSMAVLPHPAARLDELSSCVQWTDGQSTPCLRCVFPEAPPPGVSPTCDTAGVLGPAAMIVAAHQATQAIKLLTGSLDALDRSLLSIDLWSNETRRFDVSGARQDEDDDACPCCADGSFEYLEGESASATLSLCGRNAVQVTPPDQADGPAEIDLERIAHRLAPHGSFTFNRYLLRGRFAAEMGEQGEPIELTLFPTGRAIVKGVTEPEAARSIYAKYVGA